MTDRAPRWRSILFIPATATSLLARAQQRGADAVQLDLEDAIPPAQKEAARAALPDAVRHLATGPGDVLVRINCEWRHAVRDLEAAALPGVRAVTLPKVSGAADLYVADEILGELEASRGLQPGGIGLIAQIETAAGLLAMASAPPMPARLRAVTLGQEDLSRDLGAEPSRAALLEPLRLCILIARAVGAIPLGFARTIGDFDDLEALGESVRDAYAIGARGAFCIHPRQVPVLNAGFMPSAAKIAAAEAVVASFEAALHTGTGVAKLAGQMIDRPVYDRALATLADARGARA